jgi:hypothetical protein
MTATKGKEEHNRNILSPNPETSSGFILSKLARQV